MNYFFMIVLLFVCLFILANMLRMVKRCLLERTQRVVRKNSPFAHKLLAVAHKKPVESTLLALWHTCIVVNM